MRALSLILIRGRKHCTASLTPEGPFSPHIEIPIEWVSFQPPLTLSHSFSTLFTSAFTSPFSFVLAIQCCSHSSLTSLDPVQFSIQSTSKLHCTPSTALLSLSVCLRFSAVTILKIRNGELDSWYLLSECYENKFSRGGGEFNCFLSK